MTLKTVDIETLQQHVDAINIMVNLILTELSESRPQSLQRILRELRAVIDATPQLHPLLRRQLELRYHTHIELLPRN